MTPQQIARSFDWQALPPGFIDDPHPAYAALREHAPVHRLADGSVLFSRHADVVGVYRNAAVFSSDKQAEFTPKYGTGTPLHAHHTTSLVFNDAPAHSRVRQLIMGALTRRAVADMEAGLWALTQTLLTRLAQSGRGDLIEDYAAAIPVEVIGNLLNIPHADRQPLRAWSLAILGALEPQLSPQQLAAGHQAVAEFCAYLEGLVSRRRAQPGDPERDVLTRLIVGEGHEQLSHAELLHNCIFLLNAGHETTTNLIGNALVCIAQRPEARQYLLSIAEQKKPETRRYPPENASNLSSEAAWDLAIDEFLRFESSNQLGNRRATQSFELGGQCFETGTRITLCIGAANRDAAVFDDPEQLNLQRAPNRHLAFGHGIHQCAGLSLARLEGRVAAAALLARFPQFCLDGAPVRSQRLRFRGFTHVPFRVAEPTMAQ